jgi:nucleoside-diphosphate kinase
MAAKSADSWLFVVEYYDPMPQLKKTFLLKYFPDQHQAEMVDVKTKKMFLKKSACPPEITTADFFIGGKILLYSRELQIVDYGDSKTRSLLDKQTQKSFVIMPSDSFNLWGVISNDIINNFNLIAMQTINIPPSVADSIVETLGTSPSLGPILTRNTNLLVVVHGVQGVEALQNHCGALSDRHNCILITPTDPSQVTSILYSILRVSIQTTTSLLDRCTCCIIKPHAVKNKDAGSVLAQVISEGYDISAITTVQFDRVTAEEFLEVYKGVVPEYADHVVQLCSGISIVLEVRAQEDAVYSFR